ncbi:MAG: TIGR01841 family phasin [Proteobacteria bacterium]|nr:TIGR01841 family phasin [Pseudomonadota bacterium]
MSAPKKAAAANTEAVESAVQAALGPMNSLGEKVRETTEKGIEQVRVQYEAVKEAAEKATGKIEESVNAAKAGTLSFNLKALELARTNINASFDHVQALFGVKSVQDAFQLQTEFAKKQAETLAAQAKELASLGQQVVTDAVEPVKSAVASFKK